MSKKLFVGNLDYSVTEDDLKEVFSKHGEITSSKIVRDFSTGYSKGFGFVEMSSEEEANSCVSSLNGTELKGRSIKVSEARERNGGGGGGFGRDNRGGGGGRSGRGGGFGGGGGGRGRY